MGLLGVLLAKSPMYNGGNICLTNSKAQASDQKLSTRDSDVAREQHARVRSKRNHVGSNVSSQKRDGPASSSKEDGKANVASPVSVHNGVEQIPLVPKRKTPCIVDGSGRQNTQTGRQSDSDGVGDHLRPHGARSCLGPSCNIRLVGDQSGSVSETSIDSVHKEPSPLSRCAYSSGCGELVGSKFAMRVGHTENKKTPHSRDHEAGLDIEESAQLVRTHYSQREVSQPEEEKGEHACRGDSLRLGDVVGDFGIMVPKNGSQHICNKRGT